MDLSNTRSCLTQKKYDHRPKFSRRTVLAVFGRGTRLEAVIRGFSGTKHAPKPYVVCTLQGSEQEPQHLSQGAVVRQSRFSEFGLPLPPRSLSHLYFTSTASSDGPGTFTGFRVQGLLLNTEQHSNLPKMPLNTLRLNHQKSSHPNDRIVFIKPLPRPDADKASYDIANTFLRAIAAQCLPIMKRLDLLWIRLDSTV